MKGCIFNKTTIICLAIVVAGLVILLYNMWPKPEYPESERYGIYYNPYHDIYMEFLNDPQNSDYRYILFSDKIDALNVKKSDYIKIARYDNANFCITFFKDSLGKTNIYCPDEDIDGSYVVGIRSRQFVIDTISKEKYRHCVYDSKTGYYVLNVHEFSMFQCLGGYVSLSYNYSQFTPLCSIRKEM